ncbi:MAG: ROK family protein [Myxococcales bacterium]|nr:ROK family protein [Myxococcales bacterium]
MTSHVLVGVDLGGTNLRAAVVDLDGGGRVLAEERAPVGDRTPEAVADLVQTLVERVADGAALRGVGIGFAGMLRGWTGVVANAPNFGWRDVDFRGLLRARLGPSVELYNDLNAIAFGETCFGAARGARDVLCVFVGTGIGAGIVTDGKLTIGASHLAGEFGHMKVVPGGRLCGCGARGCIEAYASGRNLATRARQDLATGKASFGSRRDNPADAVREVSLAVQIAGGAERVHAGHLDEAVRAGDAYACALWGEVAPLLGLAIANAVTLLNPSRVVLGGGVWEGAPRLRELVLAAYQEAVNGPSAEAAVIVATALGDTAGVLGAAALIAAGVIS